jgi:hypothetical protein
MSGDLEEIANARQIAVNASNQLMLKMLFEMFISTSNDPEGVRVSVKKTRRTWWLDAFGSAGAKARDDGSRIRQGHRNCRIDQSPAIELGGGPTHHQPGRARWLIKTIRKR